MIRVRLVAAVIGYIIRSFGWVMAVPVLIAVMYGETYSAGCLLFTSVLAFTTGHLATLHQKGMDFDDLERLEGMAVVAFGWFFVSVFGAIPYLFFGLGFIDALFESMSGFTTTGATILTDFSRFSMSLFFFRGFTHFIGGMGILVLFVAILPHLAVAGRQLFFAETSSASKEKLTPHIRDTARRLWIWYTFLTLLEAVLLYAFGMPINDALANSFATLAAGGFSPNGQSIMGYHSPAAEWIIIFFMFLAGANFTLQVKSLNGNWGALFRDVELRFYLVIILVSTLTLFLVLAFQPGHGFDVPTLRSCLFQNLSILTTTGFASEDFESWNTRAKLVLFTLFFIGGCSGSAGGGIKVIRALFLIRFLIRGIFKAINLRAVTPVRLGNQVFDVSDVQPVLVFILVYFSTYVMGGFCLAFIENDFTLGFAGAIATLGNIGPGFGSIGPMGSFAGLHAVSKMICFVLMWAGRLEVITLVVFLSPSVWRNIRW